MPYKDPERRRQAERKWRRAHREQRAAYMRRYRKARSSGRRPGRPKVENAAQTRAAPPADWVVDVGVRDLQILPASTDRLAQESPPIDEPHSDAPRPEPARDREGLPPSPSAQMSWEPTLLFPSPIL